MHRCEWLRVFRSFAVLNASQPLQMAGPTILNYGPINPFAREIKPRRLACLAKQRPLGWTEELEDSRSPLLTIASVLVIGLVVLIAIM